MINMQLHPPWMTGNAVFGHTGVITHCDKNARNGAIRLELALLPVTFKKKTRNKIEIQKASKQEMIY